MNHKANTAIGVGPTQELSLRVSVATLARVLVKHPRNGKWMLALERKATLLRKKNIKSVEIRAQPFGGAAAIFDLQALHKKIGKFNFDSSHSRDEGDFRIFINPSSWPLLRQFSIKHLKDVHDPVLENDPARELAEEFEDCLKIRLTRDQFESEPIDIIVEETPVPTKNTRATGYPTVRVYHIFETVLLGPSLAKVVVSGSNRISNQVLSELALKDSLNGGKGRANAILVIPLERIMDFYESLSLKERNIPRSFDNHKLAETVPVVLKGIEVPKYKKI